MARAPSAFVPVLLMIGAVAAASWLQTDLGESNAVRRRNDFRYTPDAGVAQVMSCGHRSTLANAIWLRALPDFSREFDDLELKGRWLRGVLDVATDLEPTFTTAYLYGTSYLTILDRDPDDAIDLLEKGIAYYTQIEEEEGEPGRYPTLTALHRELAMAYYIYREKDAAEKPMTMKHLGIVTERPDCDMLTRMMWSSLKVDQGGDLLVMSHWDELTRHQNTEVQRKAFLELERVKKKIAIRTRDQFKEKAGRPAASVEELRKCGLLLDELAEDVFAGIDMDEEGNLVFVALAELEFEDQRRAAEQAAAIYRSDYDEWPAMAWMNKNPLATPPTPPDGMEWRLTEDGALELVAIP